MADQIVITEKSSQAKDVRAAVGSRYGDILPAEGHLLDLLEPEDLVPAWKRWDLHEQDTWFARLADGVLTAIVILLVADVLWHAIKAAIDRKLTEAGDPGLPNTDEARRRARMRTLLPIFRNILFVVVIAVAA